MTSEQLENLKRIARAATIGEWHSSPGHSGSRGRKYRGASLWAGDDEAAGCIAISHVFHPGHDANWAHIAAASPKTVLALIEEIEGLRSLLPPSVSVVGERMKAPTIRQACRDRKPLSGADAQSLEGALSLTERERDSARAEIDRTHSLAAVARRLLSIIDRKSFMPPEHQQVIRDAEEVLR